MRLPCPCCGERDSGEFTYLGDAMLVARPGADASMETWADFVYVRDNPAGRHRELWYHGAGCGAWIVVTRDTVTHEVLGAELARDVAVQRAAEEMPA